MVDINFKIGDTGTYTLIFKDNDGAVNISAFSGGTIVFAENNDPSITIVSATLSGFGGGVDQNEAVFTIPTTGFTVGDDEYRDYIAQVELTGSGIRGSFIMSCRVYKKLGDST